MDRGRSLVSEMEAPMTDLPRTLLLAVILMAGAAPLVASETSAASAASTDSTANHYDGALTMACGTPVVSLDLRFGSDGAITGNAICSGTTIPVSGKMETVAGKPVCTLEMTPGIMVGSSTTPQTSFVFSGVRVSNTGKKAKPKRLLASEKKGQLTLDIAGGA
jgi:hypothetical protein